MSTTTDSAIEEIIEKIEKAIKNNSGTKMRITLDGKHIELISYKDKPFPNAE